MGKGIIGLKRKASENSRQRSAGWIFVPKVLIVVQFRSLRFHLIACRNSQLRRRGFPKSRERGPRCDASPNRPGPASSFFAVQRAGNVSFANKRIREIDMCLCKISI
jgi:hypothetical protein